MIPPDAQRFMAGRAKATQVEAAGSHASTCRAQKQSQPSSRPPTKRSAEPAGPPYGYQPTLEATSPPIGGSSGTRGRAGLARPPGAEPGASPPGARLQPAENLTPPRPPHRTVR